MENSRSVTIFVSGGYGAVLCHIQCCSILCRYTPRVQLLGSSEGTQLNTWGKAEVGTSDS